MHYYDARGNNVFWPAHNSLTMSRVYTYPRDIYFSIVPHKILAAYLVCNVSYRQIFLHENVKSRKEWQPLTVVLPILYQKKNN
jgi:hypothetical protein